MKELSVYISALEKELKEKSNNLFNVEIEIEEGHFFCVEGHIYRDYETFGDGFNEEVISTLNYTNLEIFGAFVAIEDEEINLTQDQIVEIENHFNN